MKIYSFFISSLLVESQDVRTFKNEVCEEPTWMKVNGNEERLIQSQFPGQRNSQLEMKDQRCTFCGDDLVEMFKKRCCGASDELVDRLRRDVHIDESEIFNTRFNHIAPVEKRNLDASSWNGHDSIHIARLSQGFMSNKWDANQFLKSWKHTAIPRAGQVRSSLYHECCGDGCSSQTILDSSINQECCGAGCRYEEVLETCGAVKWVPRK